MHAQRWSCSPSHPLSATSPHTLTLSLTWLYISVRSCAPRMYFCSTMHCSSTDADTAPYCGPSTSTAADAGAAGSTPSLVASCRQWLVRISGESLSEKRPMRSSKKVDLAATCVYVCCRVVNRAVWRRAYPSPTIRLRIKHAHLHSCASGTQCALQYKRTPGSPAGGVASSGGVEASPQCPSCVNHTHSTTTTQPYLRRPHT